jgi:hypothetical protein
MFDILELLNNKLLWVGIINTIFLLIFAPHRGKFDNIIKIIEFGLYSPFYLVYELPLTFLLIKLGIRRN